MILYLEPSALVKLFVVEAHSDRVRRAVSRAPANTRNPRGLRQGHTVYANRNPIHVTRAPSASTPPSWHALLSNGDSAPIDVHPHQSTR